MNKMAIFSLLFLMLVGCTVSPTANGVTNKMTKPAWSKSYQEGLDYEVYFRNLSYLGFGKHQRDTNDPFEKKAWGIFVKLEEHSFSVMASLRKRYRIDTRPKWSARVAAVLLAKGMAWFPSATAKQLEASALRFIPQLEAIKASGPEEDRELLSFMVAHEQTLVDFLYHYNRGSKAEAIAAFEMRFKAYYPDGYPTQAI